MNNNGLQQYDYPKLQVMKEFFDKELQKIDLSKVVVIACQHILEPQKVMFEKLIALGFLPQNIFLIGKVYSTNIDILKELEDLGIKVFKNDFIATESFDMQHIRACKLLLAQSIDARVNAEKVLVLDDGGELINQIILEGNYQSVVAIEQTSSGFRKLENTVIPFPVYNVARSKTKLELETPFVVGLGIRRIEETLEKLEWKRPVVLIVGLGPIGEEMKYQLQMRGYQVVTHDKIHGEKNISDIVRSNIGLVIGTTGSQILSHNEIINLNENLQGSVLFVSMSSSDREFELWKLRDLFNTGSKIHDDVVFGNIIIANNGFPITFKGNRFEGTAEEMERTICLLFSGVCLGVLEQSLNTGLIDIPENITDRLV